MCLHTYITYSSSTEESNVNKKNCTVFEFSNICTYMKWQQRGIFLVFETSESTKHIIASHLQTTPKVLPSSPLGMPTGLQT